MTEEEKKVMKERLAGIAEIAREASTQFRKKGFDRPDGFELTKIVITAVCFSMQSQNPLDPQ